MRTQTKYGVIRKTAAKIFNTMTDDYVGLTFANKVLSTDRQLLTLTFIISEYSLFWDDKIEMKVTFSQ